MSASNLAERERAGRERTIRQQHPLLGGLILFAQSEGRGERNWRRGAEGERIVADMLDRAERDGGGFALHDRALPGSRANIDHLWITDEQVWVIDAKRWRGRIQQRDKGGWFSTDHRLFVGGRDRQAAIDNMVRSVERVAAACGLRASQTHGALCFVDGIFGWFTTPFHINGILCSWPTKLREQLPKAADLDAAATLTHRVSAVLNPKR